MVSSCLCPITVNSLSGPPYTLIWLFTPKGPVEFTNTLLFPVCQYLFTKIKGTMPASQANIVRSTLTKANTWGGEWFTPCQAFTPHHNTSRMKCYNLLQLGFGVNYINIGAIFIRRNKTDCHCCCLADADKGHPGVLAKVRGKKNKLSKHTVLVTTTRKPR